MSVTAARQLVDRTCARYGIPLLILHDFDISGFSIAKTLCSDTRRYSFRNEFQTIELGLRLDDVRDLELESEPVSLAAKKDKTRETLCRNGANEDEIDFLVNGQRVELNAMTSDQFLDFVEDKLVAAGIEKIVPPKDQLDAAYRLFTRNVHIKKIVDEAIAAHADEAEVAVPDDLEARVRDYLAQEPEAPWEDAVRHAVHLD
jgi:hypothetical protein